MSSVFTGTPLQKYDSSPTCWSQSLVPVEFDLYCVTQSTDHKLHCWSFQHGQRLPCVILLETKTLLPDTPRSWRSPCWERRPEPFLGKVKFFTTQTHNCTCHPGIRKLLLPPTQLLSDTDGSRQMALEHCCRKIPSLHYCVDTSLCLQIFLEESHWWNLICIQSPKH